MKQRLARIDRSTSIHEHHEVGKATFSAAEGYLLRRSLSYSQQSSEYIA